MLPLLSQKSAQLLSQTKHNLPKQRGIIENIGNQLQLRAIAAFRRTPSVGKKRKKTGGEKKVSAPRVVEVRQSVMKQNQSKRG